MAPSSLHPAIFYYKGAKATGKSNLYQRTRLTSMPTISELNKIIARIKEVQNNPNFNNGKGKNVCFCSTFLNSGRKISAVHVF